MSHKSDSLKDAVAIYKSKYMHMEEHNDLDLGKVLTIKASLMARVIDKQDDAVIDSILKAVELGEIQSAVLIDREKMESIINKLDPAPVNLYFSPVCPDCGSAVFPRANSKYCGFCGKALIWDEFRKNYMTSQSSKGENKCLSVNTPEE